MKYEHFVITITNKVIFQHVCLLIVLISRRPEHHIFMTKVSALNACFAGSNTITAIS